MTISASISPRPIKGSAVWTGQDLERDDGWSYELSRQHLIELGNALAVVRRQETPLAAITREQFELPTLAPVLGQIREDLCHGRGFAVMRGFPVDQYDVEEIGLLYWGLCAHLGHGITQNSDASLIHYVTDGALRPNQGTRGVGVPKESRLHVDLTDCVSLLCVQQAPDNPPSRVASSMMVHNEILRRDPKALEALYRGYSWSRMGEHGAGEAPTSDYLVPVFSEANGVVSCRFNRAWIVSAPERGAAPLGDDDMRYFELFDDISHANRFEFPFLAGDIQFCNNYTVLHGRAAHAPIENESAKRLLLRIWLDFDDNRPFVDESIVRYGIVRHGRLGWPAAATLGPGIEGLHSRELDGRPHL